MRGWFADLFREYPRIEAIVKQGKAGHWRFRFVVMSEEHDPKPDTIAVSSIEDRYPSPDECREVIRGMGFDGKIIVEDGNNADQS